MKRIAPYLVLFGILISGCSPQEPVAPPTNTPIPIEELVAEAILATQIAEEVNFSPSPPYSSLELASLLVPGDALEGAWNPSTAYDVTQPIPGYICSGYYGGCWGVYINNPPSFGAELELLQDGVQMGEAALLYFEDKSFGEAIYQGYMDKWSDIGEYLAGDSANDIWMHYYNHFNRPELGDKWLHKVGFSEWRGPDQDPDDTANNWELLQVEIVFIRCHMLVLLDLRYEVENPFSSLEDTLEARAVEQEARFDLIYAYAQEIDTRISPYACNP